MTATNEIKKPKVKLTETDGNVFAIIGAVSRALEKAGRRGQAETFRETAFQAASYNEVLQLAMLHCEVS